MKKISVISRGGVLSPCVEPLSHIRTIGLTSLGGRKGQRQIDVGGASFSADGAAALYYQFTKC